MAGVPPFPDQEASVEVSSDLVMAQKGQHMAPGAGPEQVEQKYLPSFMCTGKRV